MKLGLLYEHKQSSPGVSLWLMLSQAELWTHCCSSKPNKKYGVYWWPTIIPGIIFCFPEDYEPAFCGLASGPFLRCPGAALPMATLSFMWGEQCLWSTHTDCLVSLCLVWFPITSFQEKELCYKLRLRLTSRSQIFASYSYHRLPLCLQFHVLFGLQWNINIWPEITWSIEICWNAY